jgi:uncharacterized membrane protein YfhO
MLEWDAREKHFVAYIDSPQKLTVRLFSYPAWKVTVNGSLAAIERSDDTALMVIPLEAGQNDVRIDFGRTPDRLLGAIVSLISVIIFCFLWILTKAKLQPPDIPRIA